MWYLGGLGVVPKSALRSVFVEAEQVVEALLGGVHLGEHPPCPRAAPFPLVEQDGLLDVSVCAQEPAHAHVESGSLGFSLHEPGDSQGQYAVEGVDPDLLVLSLI